MLKKPIKVKGVEGRTALMEFIVSKRVKFLEYLKDLHSDDGALWMNTIRLTRTDLGRFFGVEDAALRINTTTAAAVFRTPSSTYDPAAGVVRIPCESSSSSSAGATASSEVAPPPSSSSAHIDPTSADATASAAVTANASSSYVALPLDKLPMQSIATARPTWSAKQLPCYVALAMSLSDLLLVPVAGDEFIEAVYALLLEVDVAFASGPATKALAQHNLRMFRQHMSPGLTAALASDGGEGAANGGAGSLNASGAGAESSVTSLGAGSQHQPTSAFSTNPSAATVTGATTTNANEGGDVETQVKFLFLRTQHLEYSASAPSYDTVIPSLCTVLIFIYRRLCDYDLLQDEECVRRMLSIDKRIQKLVLNRLTKAIEEAARFALIRDTYVLSPAGLFRELMTSTGEQPDTFLINTLLQETSKSSKEKVGASVGGSGKSSPSAASAAGTSGSMGSPSASTYRTDSTIGEEDSDSDDDME